MSKKITEFDKEFAFLSNFHEAPFTFDGIFFPTVEHFYQAQKTLNQEQRHSIANAATPGKAKRLGRTVEIRPDWEEIKLAVMETGLRIKFRNPELQQKLLATGDAILEEGNWWGDTFWGVCKGKGENHLGKLLMKLREELQGEK